MYYIGIDLGGTNIAVGLVSEDGKILRKAETPTLAKRPYADIVRDMAACIANLLDEAKLTTQDIAAIGIGIPGIAEQKTGRVIFCTNLGWRNIPLRDELKSYYDLPIFIDNDATVAGYAESIAGVSKPQYQLLRFPHPGHGSGRGHHCGRQNLVRRARRGQRAGPPDHRGGRYPLHLRQVRLH